MRRNTLAKAVRLKQLLILEAVICYIALLTVVSYAKGPARYKTLTDNLLLTSENFTIFAGNVSSKCGGLYMENTDSGNSMGYSAPLSLYGLDRVHVEFSVDCPKEYANGVLHVDLQAYGYDNDEQEFFLTLKQGMNHADFSLDPGPNPPQDVLLRLFTLDKAEYSIQNLQIYPETVLSQFPRGMIPTVIAAFTILVATIIFWINSWRQPEEDK